MTAGDGKPCARCGTSEWDKWGHCKECRRESVRRYQQANPEKTAERNRRYRQENPDKVAEGKSRWQKANPNKVAEATRRWSRANPDKVAEIVRRYQKSHPDREAERNRRYRQANLDKDAAKSHRRRTRKTQAGGSYTVAEFKALCNHYGNKCLRCGRNDVKLTADHIKPVSKGGTSNIDNMQPLCGPCNYSKQDRHIDYRPDAGPLRWLQCKLFG